MSNSAKKVDEMERSGSVESAESVEPSMKHDESI